MQNTTRSTTDILIKGSGLVGLLVALSLSKAGFTVDLEEKNPDAFNLEKELPYDLRVSSITPVSIKIFQTLGIWEKIQSMRVSPFEKIKVWEDSEDNALLFQGEEIGENPLGFVIENRVMKKVLIDALRPYLYLKIPPPSSVSTPFFKRGTHGDYKLIVAADGANSETRKAAGIQCKRKTYGQCAIVAIIETSKLHQRIARQKFLPTGPLGFLPLCDPHHCSIVWSYSEEQAKALSTMSDIEFNSALQDAFGSELGELRVISQRLIFPLSMQKAEHYIKPRFALIGDAAHTIHPLAGVGVNMGFLDAMTLTSLLKKAKSDHRDIGGIQTLRKYERIRKSENLLMLKVVDSFTLPGFRHMGISITRKSGLLRNLFMRWMSHHGEENTII